MLPTEGGLVGNFIANSAWDASFGVEMEKRGIARLTLSELEGWELDSRGLSFLSNIPFITSLYVHSYRHLIDLSPLENCLQLKRLYAGERVSKKTSFRHASLDALQHLAYGGGGGWVPENAMRNVSCIEVQSLSNVTVLDFSKCANLERILIKGSGVLEHVVLPESGSVKQLEAHKARRLKTIRNLGMQSELYRLHISKAMLFDVKCLSELKRIEELLLEDMGELGSVRLVAKLRVLHLSGSQCNVEYAK
jgi:hypothetical protein